MSKFRIKLKLTGLELEVEGSREDASSISRNIGQQMAALMRPIEGIVDGDDVLSAPEAAAQAVVEIPAKNRRRKQAGAPRVNGEPLKTIDFRHAPEKFGNPKQQWKTAQKAVWLLYVVGESMKVTELSAPMIAETFNKHFRQSGTITRSNVSRDLGKLKVSDSPPPVGEDATKSPAVWFLTDEGRKRAQNLVAETLKPQG